MFSCFFCCVTEKESVQEAAVHPASSAQITSIGTSSIDSYGFDSQILPVDGQARVFTLEEIKKATGNFSAALKVGQGGFGIVYRGKLKDGTEVAIKRARKDNFELKMTAQFQSEVNVLASIDHLNLVKFLGFYDGEEERLLVQEYVPNGNLRQHLDCEFGVVLDLFMRLDIAIDVAHALTYLHLYAERPIIHRDVKSTNILLTTNFRAKVADFGFSKVGDFDSDCVTTQVKGTAGYLDPEYLKTYQLNPKSDVYSYGILLMELITGRKPIESNRPIDEKITIRWAFKKFLENKVDEIMDPKMEKTQGVFTVIRKMAELAFHCSAPTKHDRPSMKDVAEALWALRKQYQDNGDLRTPNPEGK